MIRATGKIRRLLAANRSEIAIRVFRAATELGIQTVAVYSTEDRFALHRFKADESYRIGEGKGPVEAYLDIEDILRIAREARVDAIHPGYGFLSESPRLAARCAEEGIVFVGPDAAVMERLGNKIVARRLADEAGVPVLPATGALPEDDDAVRRLAAGIGYPVMIKASWGGGGRGMRAVGGPDDLADQVEAARREAGAAFGNREVYLEKLLERARHVEVQILADHHGNTVHLFERDCSVQRRNQKVVERAPAPYLGDAGRDALCAAALAIARTAGYVNAGTVEFLIDVDSGDFFFIEVNPRIQVEHTVTEAITGIDLVKAQIRIAGGARIGEEGSGVPVQDDIRRNGHAIQCRITTEDPENNFVPDYGRILAYRGANGFGIRLDGGTAYSGALITRFYDSLLEKVTAWGPTPEEVIARMDRALREFRIRGVATNLAFLENVLGHPAFRNGDYTTRFIDDTPELFKMPARRDRASRLLRFIGEVLVNGNDEVKDRPRPGRLRRPVAPDVRSMTPAAGTKQLLEAEGPEGVAAWMKRQRKLLITDTTMRDAHQSLLATRVRSYDLIEAAPAYAALLPDLFSVECWGGATFDVALRFLKEDPWECLERLRDAMPNLLLQMLFRASNGVGYTTYPDNAVTYFIDRAAEAGIDVFRIFDSLNWVDNMRVSIEAVLATGRICEAAICYTGDILDPGRSKYDLDYYVDMARKLEATGAHILGIKDMAGLLTPEAAGLLVSTLKREIALPIHFHTHDTSGIAAASVLAAAEAGVDAIDAALDSMSGLTSQPNLGSIAAALRHTPRDTGLDGAALGRLSDYWEQVRANYAGFESDIRAGTSDVYRHQMPGGQYTNLRQQARSLGIEDRWSEVSRAYSEVNQMFGDIVKVTPSSKVVGDMALMMVTSGLSRDDVMNAEREIAFPESVVAFFKGELGQPVGGFPEGLRKKVLKGAEPITVRPGSVIAAVDLEAERKAAEKKVRRSVDDRGLASYLMYPKVYADYIKHRREYGAVGVLPSATFFYGMEPGEEIAVDIERGKTLIIRFRAVSEADDEGRCTVFFELNGQPRTVKIADRNRVAAKASRPKAESDNPDHVASPMPGLVIGVAVTEGQTVAPGDVLMSIEAMKMETAVLAERDGRIKKIVSPTGTQVDAKDLLVVLGPPPSCPGSPGLQE